MGIPRKERSWLALGTKTYSVEKVVFLRLEWRPGAHQVRILILSELKQAWTTVQRQCFSFLEKERGKDAVTNVMLKSMTVLVFQGKSLWFHALGLVHTGWMHRGNLGKFQETRPDPLWKGRSRKHEAFEVCSLYLLWIQVCAHGNDILLPAVLKRRQFIMHFPVRGRRSLLHWDSFWEVQNTKKGTGHMIVDSGPRKFRLDFQLRQLLAGCVIE